jgi:hypothetical protein
VNPGPALASSGRDSTRIVTSGAVSALGTWSYNVGIAVYAYQETQSTAWVAIATVGRYIPALLITWWGSRLAARFPQRTVAVSADVFCALIMLALAAVASVHGALVLAIGLAALSSGAARVQNSAVLAVAADVVTESRLARTALLLSTWESVATALGPAVAAVVLAVTTPAALFVLNGLTFAISASLVAGVAAAASRRVRPTWTDHGPSAVEAYRGSIRTVWPLLATRTIAAFVYGIDIVLLAVIATAQLNQGTRGYGWLLAGAGAGGLAAAWLLRSRSVLRTSTASGGLVLYALPLLAFLLRPDLAESLVVQGLRGFGAVVVTATVVAGLQRGIPSSASGPVFGLTHTLVLAGTCTGAIAAPLLLGAFGLAVTIVVAALVPVLLQLVVLPGLLAFDRTGADSLAALDPRVDVLRRLTLFQDATRATLYDVADRAVEEAPEPGQRIVVEGDNADALFVLVAGSVDVTLGTGDSETFVRTMTSPSYFGEIGLLHGVARTATVTANDGVVVWRVPADTFLDAVAQAGLSSALTENVRRRFTPIVDDPALTGPVV